MVLQEGKEHMTKHPDVKAKYKAVAHKHNENRRRFQSNKTPEGYYSVAFDGVNSAWLI